MTLKEAIKDQLFLCRYREADGECGTPIILDAESPSGFSHAEGRDWCHWAAPMTYGPQDSQAAFVKRVVVEGLKVEEGEGGTAATDCDPQFIEKMRDFAKECLTRYKMNPNAAADILHTKETYADILILCSIAAAQHLKREQEGSEAIASKAIDRILRGFNSHEEAVAYLAPLLTATQPPQELVSLRECADALDSIWAAIGDALCSGKGIEKAYANKVASEARQASDKARAALTRGAVGPKGAENICPICYHHFIDCDCPETLRRLAAQEPK